MNVLRRWVSRRLYIWSMRLWEDWHQVSLLDGSGDTVAVFGYYGDGIVTGAPPAWDFRCSCEETP